MKVFFVDDFSVVRICQRISAKLPGDFLLQSIQQLITDVSVTENIVWCHTGLSAVQKFAKHNAPGGEPYFRGGIHDAGTLPT